MGVDSLYENINVLFMMSANELTSEEAQLHFSRLPEWARLMWKDVEKRDSSLENLENLWNKLNNEGIVHRGQKNYNEWVEAQIAVIKAAARLDGNVGTMVKKAAVYDGSLPQRWRAFWAYLNIR